MGAMTITSLTLSLSPNPGKTAAFSFNVPAGYYTAQFFITNNTANAITGGLKFGTSAGGTDVITAIAVGANAVIHVPDATVLKRRYAKASAQTIFVDAVTAWNSANIDLDVILVKYI